jgi:isocitrate dehydrogenase kinase/phosphatase
MLKEGIMTIKDAMSRLKNSFAYERFQKAIRQDPWDVHEVAEAHNALIAQESELIKPILESVCNNCLSREQLSPKILFMSEEELDKIFRENKPFKAVFAATERWRKELMPDFHELIQEARKLYGKEQVSQAQM